jgi:hypothetical protein
MAHTLDATASIGGQTGTSISLSLTTTTGATAIIVGLSVVTNTARTGGSPTYAGQTMILGSSQTTTGSNNNQVEVWYLLNPLIGAANIVIPNTGALTISITAAAFKAAAGLDTVLDVVNTASANNGLNPNVALTTTNAGDAVFSVVTTSGGTLTAGQTSISTGTTGAGAATQYWGGQYALQVAAGAISMNWTASAGKYSTAAVSLREASRGRGLLMGVGA